MPKPKVYADLQNADTQGRLRLDCPSGISRAFATIMPMLIARLNFSSV